MKVKYNLPICLAGDFNAHTGIKNDFLEQDNLLADLFGCEELSENSSMNCSLLNGGFTANRYNQDTSDINRNGQALNLRIVNGRFGSHKYFGGQTTYSSDASVIDYVIVCERM